MFRWIVSKALIFFVILIDQIEIMKLDDTLYLIDQRDQVDHTQNILRYLKALVIDIAMFCERAGKNLLVIPRLLNNRFIALNLNAGSHIVGALNKNLRINFRRTIARFYFHFSHQEIRYGLNHFDTMHILTKITMFGKDRQNSLPNGCFTQTCWSLAGNLNLREQSIAYSLQYLIQFR